MTNIGLEKKLWGHKWAAVIFVGTLLAALALALAPMAGPARACSHLGEPCDTNSPPTVTRDNASVTVNEGLMATNTGNYSDLDGDEVTLSKTSGPGTLVQDPGGNVGTWSWSFPTTDGPDQGETVTITASDGQASRNTTFTLTVNNVAPTVTLQAPTPRGYPLPEQEGYHSYEYPWVVSDPGDDSWTTVGFADCGAGGQIDLIYFGGARGENGNVRCSWPNGPSSPVVSVRVRDSDGAESNTATRTVNVANANPTATLNAPGSVNEGSPATVSFTGQFDPSANYPGSDMDEGLHYAFDCNGGSLSGATYANSGTSASTNCTYNDGPDTKTVRARIIDQDGGFSEYTKTISVNNVAPTTTLSAGNPLSVNENSAGSPTYNFSVSDPGNDTWTSGASCGARGTKLSETATSVTCRFPDGPASSDISVTSTDSDNAAGNTATQTVNVANVAPTATFSAPASVNQGANFTLSLTNIFDPSSADNANLTYAFDCGNGSGYSTPGSDPSKNNCNAVDQPTITVKGKVTDKDGGSNEYTANVTVNNVNPTGTITINGGAATTNSASVNLTLSATDPLPGSGVGSMRFRNENTETWDGVAWEPYAASRAWQLSSGDGTKTVFVEYKDNAGNVSQGTISDQIQLDTTTPPDTDGDGVPDNLDACPTVAANTANGCPPPPSLRINDVRVGERTTTTRFTVRLSAPSQQTITVRYATANGTAKAPADYATRRGTLTFLPGQITKTISVPIRGDRLNERNETFFVRLSGATKATIADSSGRGTIIDND